MKSARFKAVKNVAIFHPIKYRNGAEKGKRFRPTMAVRYPHVSAHYPRQKYGRNTGGEGWFNGGRSRFVCSFKPTFINPRQFLAPFISVRFSYVSVSASRAPDGHADGCSFRDTVEKERTRRTRFEYIFIRECENLRGIVVTLLAYTCRYIFFKPVSRNHFARALISSRII